jgi:hypothetical protein
MSLVIPASSSRKWHVGSANAEFRIGFSMTTGGTRETLLRGADLKVGLYRIPRLSGSRRFSETCTEIVIIRIFAAFAFLRLFVVQRAAKDRLPLLDRDEPLRI